jgi:cellulose synthase/poly-beta-1,6-N-acetylglucosamine synthase-like glycosyltransferase
VSLEIVIPDHNEQHRIGQTLTSYCSGLLSHQLQLTVGLDDCMYATAEIVAQHAAHDPRVRVISHQRLGKGGVVAGAFQYSRADLLAFVDADCATEYADDMARAAGW